MTKAEPSLIQETARIGLIAGYGRFPISFAQAARRRGLSVVAVAIEAEASPELEQYVDRLVWLSPGNLSGAIETFQTEGVEELVLAGKIPKHLVFERDNMDPRITSILDRLASKDDDSVLRAIASLIESSGLRVRKSTCFLSTLVPRGGVLTKRRPTREEHADIQLGIQTAREIARLGIGQTVVLKDGVIVAVEAIEGTDETIRRAGQLSGSNLVVVKCSGPRQDLRFDMPVVGLQTIETLLGAGATALAVEADRTIILDRPEVIATADEKGLAIVAV